jgi:hypothetical protein
MKKNRFAIFFSLSFQPRAAFFCLIIIVYISCLIFDQICFCNDVTEGRSTNAVEATTEDEGTNAVESLLLLIALGGRLLEFSNKGTHAGVGTPDFSGRFNDNWWWSLEHIYLNLTTKLVHKLHTSCLLCRCLDHRDCVGAYFSYS